MLAFAALLCATSLSAIMGCCLTAQSPLPPSAPEEERIIALNEADLRFYSTGVTRAFDFLISDSRDGLLTPSQFRTWTTVLDLNTLDLDTIDSKLQRLYKRFKEGKGRFNARKLSVLTALLAGGSSKERAEVLCKGWMLGRETEVLDRNQVRELLECMIEIASEWLPELATEEISQHGRSLTKSEVASYIARLKTSHDTVFHEAYLALLGPSDQISTQDFLFRLQNNDFFTHFLTSSSIRLTLLEANPPISIRE